MRPNLPPSQPNLDLTRLSNATGHRTRQSPRTGHPGRAGVSPPLDQGYAPHLCQPGSAGEQPHPPYHVLELIGREFPQSRCHPAIDLTVIAPDHDAPRISRIVHAHAHRGRPGICGGVHRVTGRSYCRRGGREAAAHDAARTPTAPASSVPSIPLTNRSMSLIAAWTLARAAAMCLPAAVITPFTAPATSA